MHDECKNDSTAAAGSGIDVALLAQQRTESLEEGGVPLHQHEVELRLGPRVEQHRRALLPHLDLRLVLRRTLERARVQPAQQPARLGRGVEEITALLVARAGVRTDLLLKAGNKQIEDVFDAIDTDGGGTLAKGRRRKAAPRVVKAAAVARAAAAAALPALSGKRELCSLTSVS